MDLGHAHVRRGPGRLYFDPALDPRSLSHQLLPDRAGSADGSVSYHRLGRCSERFYDLSRSIRPTPSNGNTLADCHTCRHSRTERSFEHRVPGRSHPRFVRVRSRQRHALLWMVEHGQPKASRSGERDYILVRIGRPLIHDIHRQSSRILRHYVPGYSGAASVLLPVDRLSSVAKDPSSRNAASSEVFAWSVGCAHQCLGRYVELLRLFLGILAANGTCHSGWNELGRANLRLDDLVRAGVFSVSREASLLRAGRRG